MRRPSEFALWRLARPGGPTPGDLRAAAAEIRAHAEAEYGPRGGLEHISYKHADDLDEMADELERLEEEGA